MKVWQKNVILLIFVLILVITPLYLNQGAEFGGADGAANDLILETNPDYEPWFEPIIEPASGEIESLLFVTQAAIGSGIVCFILGRITAKKG